ncbi:uncharacterized protein N7459_002755 [Penicillium hispanicum]|uniref:uncharacterized protein n=1 Tax=Penicillium hispanicum TaxID=1080232 RepID=UPI0025410F97|nr:uncharacterized protein N7459_002755 [Penicillium hispanicum]KAJ5586990.1 hypothetical protein N7459_002755 [Penicillium hispanicum]
MTLSWPWHFVALSDEDKLHRRELLDLRGSYAQWSVIVVIVAIRIYQGWATAFSSVRGASKPPHGPASGWDRPLIAGSLETRRQYFICGLWLLWLFGLSVWNSGEDYLHLTKALGHVALSQIPLQVLMSPAAYISTSKPSASSIFSFLTSVPQATVTPYHRLFGRVVISPLLFGHATLYLLMFAQSSYPRFSSLLAKRVRDFDVQCGLLAVSAAIAVLLFVRPRAATGKSQVRARPAAKSMQERRRSFYIGHVVFVGVLCVAAYFHVAQAQRYMGQALGAFVLNGACSLVAVRWGGKL